MGAADQERPEDKVAAGPEVLAEQLLELPIQEAVGAGANLEAALLEALGL